VSATFKAVKQRYRQVNLADHACGNRRGYRLLEGGSH
jgi:hypothetical protein